MTKFKIAIIAIISFFWIAPVNAANYSHVISLNPGWNLISTPRIIENHQFSASETLSNFSIYLQSSSSTSGWKTMSEMGQNEFTPLYGYFIYNNTGSNQTLTLNYKQNNSPSERMFSRHLSAGWNVLGIANPSYALKQKDNYALDNNNVSNILNSINSSVSNVLDLTATSTNKSSVLISNTWNQKVFSEANQLDDFRETKAYAVYLNSINNYDGFQNDDEIILDNEPISTSTVLISRKSTSPFDTTIVRGTDSTVLISNIKADEAIIADGLNLTYATTTADQFENARVYLNGLLLDSFDLATTTNFKALNSSLTLNKGDNEIKIMVKSKTTAIGTSSISFTLSGTTMFSAMNPKYFSSNNPVTSDKISGDAISSIFTVNMASLTTTISDGYAINKTIIQGSSDVSLGKFTIRALNDDVKITSISLGANIGATTTGTSTIPATSINDMKLYVDGTQVGNTVDFGSTGANFSSLSFLIAKDSTKNIEIKGAFDTSATGTFMTLMTVNAQDSRGTSVSSGNNATTTQFVVIGQGTLNAELGGNTPADAILAAKSIEQEVGQFKFTAINDDANLTELYVINTESTSTNASMATSSLADARISAVKLYDGANLIDSFVPVNGAGKFTITNNAVKVLANNSKTLSIKVVLNNIDNDANATNKVVHFGITTLKFKSSNGTENTQAVAKVANNFLIRKTVPTVALATLPTTVLTSGDQVISKFTVTADANGDVELNKIVLDTTNTSNATITALGAGATLKVNGSYKTIASSTYAANKLTIAFATNEVISAGTSKTFEVLATLAVSGQGSESVTTKISEDATYSADGNFVWSDGASVSSYTYSNGHRVPGLTTTTQVLSK